MDQAAIVSESVDETPTPRRGELTAHRASVPSLTGIRFLAAMYVVFYHSHFPSAMEQQGWLMAAQFFRNGLLAVPLFFILSGFILSYTYEGQIDRPGGYGRFWEARFARVWPLYFVSLLLGTIFDHTTPNSIPLALSTILMVQAWNPFNLFAAGSWNFVCWTLSVECFFYLSFPWLQRWLERLRTSRLVVVFGVAVAIAVVGKTGGISYLDTRGIRYIPLAVIHLPEFVVGLCVGNMFLRKEIREAIASLNTHGMVTIFVAVACIWLLCHPLQGAAAWTALGFALLLFFLAVERSPLQRLLSRRAMIVGGQISFGIYLLQWPVKTVVYRLCDNLRVDAMPERFAVYCAALMAISAAGFYGIEEPTRKFIRRVFAVQTERRRARRVGIAT